MNKSLKRLLCVTLLLVFAFFCGNTSHPTTQNYVVAKGECVIEANSRRILYESHGDIRLPMASTTKILTAITVLEHCKNIKSVYTIPKQAEGVEGSSVYLKAGDNYTIEDLLYGLMLRSGNDCATALALYTSGSIPNFSAKMNEVAEKAGAFCSNFVNPHGLPQSGHYTTARDLSYITAYAMQNPTFKKIVSTRYYEPRHWKNKNKMLQFFDNAVGVKTGYTKQAGRCLVSAIEKEGMTLICTVLSCPTTYERSTKLLEDAFKHYNYTPIIKADETFTVEDNGKTYKCSTQKNYYYPILKEEEKWLEVKTYPYENKFKPKKNNKIIGQFEIYLAKRLLFSGNLYKL